MGNHMDIVDDHTLMEFIHTAFQREMKRIDQILSGYSGDENRFQKNKHRLDYFARFLAEYQYFDSTLKKKPFFVTFKDIFEYLSDWEKGYTKGMEMSNPSAVEFRGIRNSFRHMSKSFINNIVDSYFMFNRNDDEVGVYAKYKRHKSQHYSLKSLEVLETFVIDYSRVLIGLITFELDQGMISNVLRELLSNTKLLDRLQYLSAKEWYQLSQNIQEKAYLQPSPILRIVFNGKKRRKPRGSQGIPTNIQEFFMQIIDQRKLIEHNKELTHQVKTEEMSQITEVIKELLAELQEGDEIIITDALAIIIEDNYLEYLTSVELEEYFKNMLVELPDFDYIRLKKSFRRKSSPLIELQNNIDIIFKKTVSSSLQTIEDSLGEIQAGQQELLTQTKQIQEFLETQFDVVIENQVKIEEFLFQKLGSDFEKIKHLWTLYKNKQIKGKEFVQEASKILGTKFSKIFFDIMYFLK